MATFWKHKYRENWLIALGSMLFLLWQSLHLNGLQWDYDEGPNLAAARLLYAGYALYTDGYATHPPLFFHALRWVFNFPGHSIELGRLVIVLSSVVGLLATAFSARILGGSGSGILALILLIWQPLFLKYSKVIINDIPSMSLAIFSLWMILVYWKTRKKHWLIASGIGIGFAIALKFMPLYLLPLIILPIFYRHFSDTSLRPTWKYLGIDLLLWGTSTVITFAIPLLSVNINNFFAQTIAFHINGQTVYNIYPNWVQILQNRFMTNAGFSLLSIAGTLYIFRRDRFWGIWAALWIALTLIALLSFSPMWEHFLTVWTFPVAILTAIALKNLTTNVSKKISKNITLARLDIFAVAGVLWAVIMLPYQFMLQQHDLSAPTPPHYTTIITFLQNNIDAGRYIITDEQILAIAADTALPPKLIETSNMRFLSGQLTTTDLIAYTQQYHPQAIIFTASGRFLTRAPGYFDWVAQNYQQHSLSGNSDFIFVERTP